MILTACPFCAAPDIAPAHRRSDGRATARCGRCGLEFLQDRPDDVSLFYDADYFDKGTGAAGADPPDVGYAAYSDCQEVDFRWQLALLCLFAPPRARVLELGSATGLFLSMARRWEFPCRGVELIPSAAERARESGLDVTCASIEQLPAALPAGERFDVICAWEFIEHVADLRGALAAIRGLLAPGGVFLFSTPDAGAPVVRERGDQWIGFRSSLEHLTYLDREFLHGALGPLFGGPPVTASFDTGGDTTCLVGAARVGGPSDGDRALEALLQRREEPPAEATAETLEHLGWVLLQLRDTRALERVIVRLAVVHPPRATMLRAGERLLAGQLDEAGALLEEVLRRAPGSLIAWQWLARIHRVNSGLHARGRQEEAAEVARLRAEVEQLRAEVERQARHIAERTFRRELRAGVTAASWSAGHWMMRNVVARTPVAQPAWKVFDVLQKEGASGVGRRITRLARGRLQRRQAMERLTALGRSSKLPVVLSPAVDWNITLFQRPQQMALALGALGWPCLYVTSHQAVDRGGCDEIAPGCFLVEHLDMCFEALPRFGLVVFSTSPQSIDIATVRSVAGRAVVVYDFIDEVHPDIYQISDAMRARHDYLVAEADLVSVTADRLQEQVASRAGPSLLCPNAADVEHFRLPSRPAPPADLQPILARGRPVIGYYGALARWFDYALVRRLAVERPDLELVLIGVDYDRSLEKSGLQRLPNVHMMGPRPYQALGGYAAWFDVATIPFLVNEVTQSTSPIKLFEYMAARKPIVTTGMRECRKYRSVLIGEDHAHFLRQIEHALSLRGDADYLATLDREADENSWRHRATDLATEMERLAAARRL